MKKLFTATFLLILIPVVMGASYYGDFIATSVSLAASTTKVNGTNFTSIEVAVPADKPVINLWMTFTRAAGSATLTVDFYFQVSPDNGTTWGDLADPISIETGRGVISGTTVRITKPAWATGNYTHIRLAKIVNNDTVNDLTLVNAAISL